MNESLGQPISCCGFGPRVNYGHVKSRLWKMQCPGEKDTISRGGFFRHLEKDRLRRPLFLGHRKKISIWKKKSFDISLHLLVIPFNVECIAFMISLSSMQITWCYVSFSNMRHVYKKKTQNGQSCLVTLFIYNNLYFCFGLANVNPNICP